MMRKLAALENRVRQIEEGFENEIAVEDLIRCDLAEMIGGITTEANTAFGTSDACEINERVHLELTAMLGALTENAEGETENG